MKEFERDAYGPGEYERLQKQFAAEARAVFDAIVEEHTDLNGKVDMGAALMTLAVKYLSIRYDWTRLREERTIASATTRATDLLREVRPYLDLIAPSVSKERLLVMVTTKCDAEALAKRIDDFIGEKP